MEEELITIATYTNPIEAHLAKDVLSLHSIDSCILDENTASLGFIVGGSLITVRLQVRESDADRAVRILEQELGDHSSPQLQKQKTGGIMQENRYEAAGAVVVHDDWVLVLHRPSRNEVRLPKGHIDEGEEPLAGALREVEEESGYGGLKKIADLGVRSLEFCRGNVRVIRNEHFFLLTSEGEKPENGGECEEQFQPEWVSWDDAEKLLTFENEKEWVKTARAVYSSLS